MKYLAFCAYELQKGMEMAPLADKLASSPPAGFRLLADYVCGAHPVPGLPLGTHVSIWLIEAESSDAYTAALFPFMLVGATIINVVPILEMPHPGATEELARLTALTAWSTA